ncbi:hypothetical protein K6959_16245 [Bacillus aquiflavi]|uniref:hypothetical protein n=1 Tax=Bacillus aquiflavi TaxID=2672567 RepID=UPI001CA993D8|nr:hypothetical protein [Bacillus aquiflavi]UAC48108.1 hypothetical protein K6959_16245 [Bacillus aquiflavi]
MDTVVNIADVYILINGETKHVLRNYPVRIELGFEGLYKYEYYVSDWIVENKETSKQSFVIVLQKNGAKVKKLPNGDLEGHVLVEKLKFLSFTIQEDGTVTKDSFTYKNKNKLQTKLVPPIYGGAGYYTDGWLGYPVLGYPFFTAFLGLVLILVCFSYKFLFKKRTS